MSGVFGTGRRRALLVAATVGPLCSGTVAAGCSDGKSTTKPTAVAQTTSVATTTAPPATVVDPGTAAGLTIKTTNKWLPLTPGLQLVSQGFVNAGHRRLPHRRVYTITDVVKQIDGMRTVLVLDQDFDGGEIAEQAVDYLAEDDRGNVLYLGSYTESYEGGQFVNASDAWLSGVQGAEKGILMPADPRTGSPSFTEAKVPGEGATTAEVARTGQQTCVPFKCYADVLVIREGSENKYFAPGVGGIKTEPLSGGAQETEELINLTELSPQGLAEISTEALRLDQHAATEAKDVFGRSAAATRTT
jgi:hypothetical protein